MILSGNTIHFCTSSVFLWLKTERTLQLLLFLLLRWFRYIIFASGASNKFHNPACLLLWSNYATVKIDHTLMPCLSRWNNRIHPLIHSSLITGIVTVGHLFAVRHYLPCCSYRQCTRDSAPIFHISWYMARGCLCLCTTCHDAIDSTWFFREVWRSVLCVQRVPRRGWGWGTGSRHIYGWSRGSRQSIDRTWRDPDISQRLDTVVIAIVTAPQIAVRPVGVRVGDVFGVGGSDPFLRDDRARRFGDRVSILQKELSYFAHLSRRQL